MEYLVFLVCNFGSDSRENSTSNSSLLFAYPPYVCISIPLIAAKHVPMTRNTQTATEELVDVTFSMQSLSYQRKVGHYFFPEPPVSK
jgi:hypothetical protein